MQAIPAAVILIFTFFPGTAVAQTEYWDTYIATFAGKPGSVMVDMGLINNAPDKRYPYVVITGPVAQKCNGQGLPDKDEIPVLEDILESTGNFLKGVTAQVLVGTFTYDCKRVNYYYVKDSAGARTAIRRMYNHNFKNYDYAVNIKYDPEWKTYTGFLYPDEATQNWMQNSKIIEQLKANGNDLKKPLEVNFELYFKFDIDRASFRQYAEKNGYTIKKLVESNKDPKVYAIVVSKKMIITPDDISRVTSTLRDQAKTLHGTFSGWTAEPLPK